MGGSGGVVFVEGDVGGKVDMLIGKHSGLRQRDFQ